MLPRQPSGAVPCLRSRSHTHTHTHKRTRTWLIVRRHTQGVQWDGVDKRPPGDPAQPSVAREAGLFEMDNSMYPCNMASQWQCLTQRLAALEAVTT